MNDLKVNTLSQRKFEAIVEDLWERAATIQNLTYLLMGDLGRGLSEQRATAVEDTHITLVFQRRGIDVTNWLAGEAWAKTLEIEEALGDLMALVGEPDPMVEAIAAYRKAAKEFARLPQIIVAGFEDAHVEATYGPILTSLTENPPAVTSLEGVREAIRLAFDENAFCSQLSEAVLKSALSYLDEVGA